MPPLVPLFPTGHPPRPEFRHGLCLARDELSTTSGKSVLRRRTRGRPYELRERVSEREKFYIESHYYDFDTGDLEKARQVYELWEQTYPRDQCAPNNLGVSSIRNLGQYEKVLAAKLGGSPP